MDTFHAVAAPNQSILETPNLETSRKTEEWLYKFLKVQLRFALTAKTFRIPYFEK